MTSYKTIVNGPGAGMEERFMSDEKICNGPHGDEESCPVHGEEIRAARAKRLMPITGKMIIRFDGCTGSTHMTDREHWGELMAEQINAAAPQEAPIGVGPVPATHIPCISVTETAKPIPGLVSSLTDVVALGQCAFCPKQAFHELHLCNDHFAAWPTSIKLPPTAELREALRFTPNDIQGVLIQVDGKGTNLARSRELAEALSLAGRIRMGIDRRAALAQADRNK